MEATKLKARAFWAALIVVCVLAVLLLTTVPGFFVSRCRDYERLHCASHLKQIYAFALSQAQQSGRVFSAATGTPPCAHTALNRLNQPFPDEMPPELFVCPTGEESPADSDEHGSFTLTAETSSYAWTAVDLPIDGRPRPLAACKHSDAHRAGVNVLLSDGSVQSWKRSRLDPMTGLPPGLTR